MLELYANPLIRGFTTNPTLMRKAGIGDYEAFARDVFPHSELTSSPYVAYTLYTPTYRTVQNVGTYDLVEDFRSGPKLDASLVSSLRTLGSDRHFTRPPLGELSGGNAAFR